MQEEGEPDVAYLLPPVDFLVLMTPSNEMVEVPGERFFELAGDHFEWLDERHAMVRPFSETEYQNLLGRARRYDSKPLGSGPAGAGAPEGRRPRWEWFFG